MLAPPSSYAQRQSPGPAMNQAARVLPAALERNITSLLEHGVVGQALSALLGDGHGPYSKTSPWLHCAVRSDKSVRSV